MVEDLPHNSMLGFSCEPDLILSPVKTVNVFIERYLSFLQGSL